MTTPDNPDFSDTTPNGYRLVGGELLRSLAPAKWGDVDIQLSDLSAVDGSESRTGLPTERYSPFLIAESITPAGIAEAVKQVLEQPGDKDILLGYWDNAVFDSLERRKDPRFDPSAHGWTVLKADGSIENLPPYGESLPSEEQPDDKA